MKGFTQLWLHDEQRPDAVDARLRAALCARRLPPRLLYDSHAQAGRWLRYHEAWSPARSDPEVEALYPGLGARHLDGRVLVSLGCGGGQKDLAILRAARGRAYVAVDTSPSLAAGSSARARKAGFEARAAIMDLEAPCERAAFGPGPVVFAALGLVPNFELPALAGILKGLLRPGDGLIISANLGSAEDSAILSQYDNAEARAWVLGALTELGLQRDAISLEVTGRRVDETLSRIEARLRLRADQSLDLPFFRERWRAGDELLAFFSNRLSRAGAGESLAKALGHPLLEEASTDVEGAYFFEA